MPTPLTGSLGWSGLYPLQLGGPPLINTYAKTIPAQASPLIAHLYQNDGVTFIGSFQVLNLPPLVSVTANGGMEQIQLEIASLSATGMIWGLFTWGGTTYGGGFNITQGNVVRLTFQGGDGAVVYSGIVEDLPDVAMPGRTQHIILLSPFGFELDDVHSNSVYSVTVDIAQIVRDAVAQTVHCSCDQTSVPAYTGIAAPLSTGGAIDFRDQTLKQQIDTCRSIAGPTWYWHVDELGRVWFQYMGSAATYTVMRGPHYQERTSAASIQDRKNRVRVVGGVPTGGSANVVAIYNGTSQAPGPNSIGVRALNPPLAVPNITDQATLTAIAATIGGVLDRVWRRVQLKIQRPYSQRIHGSQPGGAMLRYWEPVTGPIPQSAGGTGAYSGTYIAQRVEYDGLNQNVTAGDIPVTNQNDVTNMVRSIVSLGAARSVIVAAAALNLSQQVLTGTFVSGTTTTSTITTGGNPATLWSLDRSMFQAFDPAGTARIQLGNLPVNGISPAQWGGRANAADGTPIWDSLGVVGLPKTLASVTQISAVQGTNTALADVSGGVTPTFTLSRTGNVLVMAMGRVGAQPVNTGNIAFLGLRCGSDQTAGAPNEVDAATTTLAFYPFSIFFLDTLAAGSYTAALQAYAQPVGVGAQWNVAYLSVAVFLFGG
jgi:hypothetical protein